MDGTYYSTINDWNINKDLKDKAGKCTGILFNDTCGGVRKNNLIIYILKSKYEQMRSNTLNFSSIICIGKKV